MNTFKNYALYYNLLYQDKDYVGEAQFVHQLLQKHDIETQTLLELGCGTGIHAMLLAEIGYHVHGIDVSSEMLQQANGRLSQLPQNMATRLTFSQGDIRTIRLNAQFDAIISLFHVISYQTANADLQAVLATVKAHLKPGGVFIFDYWYGPAVLSEHPTIKVKRLEDENIHVTRIAEPVMSPNDNLVDVHYSMFIKHKQNGVIEEIQETHQMRYLFKPELELLFVNAQLKPLEYREWMTNREPGVDTWGIYSVVTG